MRQWGGPRSDSFGRCFLETDERTSDEGGWHSTVGVSLEGLLERVAYLIRRTGIRNLDDDNLVAHRTLAGNNRSHAEFGDQFRFLCHGAIMPHVGALDVIRESTP